MRSILILLLLSLLNSFSHATTYYVKASGGTGSGLDDANAWSITKLNSSSLAAGDNVLFKKGDIFYGNLSVGNGINYGVYGTGNNPVISGFTVLSSWTLSNGNVYYASLDVPNLAMVTVDGGVKAMGRYPNTGYLPYTSHTSNSSISSASVTTLPFNPTGGEVVIRKQRWILDKHPITSVAGNTINYSSGNFDYDGYNNTYEPTDGNGYFVEGCLGALDQDGEWYYDVNAKRLYIYFAGNPSGRTVLASSTSQIVSISSQSNISFNNIDFVGGNYGLYMQGASNITLTGCNFKQQGVNGIYAINSNAISFSNGSITDSNNNGFFGEYNVKSTSIINSTFSNIGTIAGMGRSGDGAYVGIKNDGDNITIQNNTVKNTGYNGIDFTGNNVLVEHNLVDTYCTLKDDGGGIYTWIGNNVTGSNRIIRSNIVLNGIGAYKGAEGYYYEPFGKAVGIYLDNYSNHVEVSGNTVAHGNWTGILSNSNGNNQYLNNLVYDHAQQFCIMDYSTSDVRNLTITGNTFIAKTADQKTLYVEIGVNDDPTLFGTINNNIYARPIDDNLTISVNKRYSGGGGEVKMSLENWKTNYHQDANSKKSSVTISDLTKFRFDYNYSNVSPSIPLINCWTDVKNVNYQTALMLPPFSGKVLISSFLNKPLIVSL